MVLAGHVLLEDDHLVDDALVVGFERADVRRHLVLHDQEALDLRLEPFHATTRRRGR